MCAVGGMGSLMGKYLCFNSTDQLIGNGSWKSKEFCHPCGRKPNGKLKLHIENFMLKINVLFQAPQHSGERSFHISVV